MMINTLGTLGLFVKSFLPAFREKQHRNIFSHHTGRLAKFGWILTYLKISAEMAVTWFLPRAIHFLVTHPLGHRTCQMSWESWCGGWSLSGCFFLYEHRLVAALPYSEGCPATWEGTGKREKGMKKWMKKIKIFISYTVDGSVLNI